jgi:MFS family permease
MERLNTELLLLGGVVVLGTMMTVLDLTVVNVAIPTLGRDFATSISTIQWVLTGYMLAFASVTRSPAGRASGSAPSASI